MKGYIISHHCINSQIGRNDAHYFAEKYTKYLDKTSSTSPLNPKDKVEIDFDKYKGTIVYFSLLCGHVQRPLIVFGAENGDRVYVPDSNGDFKKLLRNHSGTSAYPSWYRALM